MNLIPLKKEKKYDPEKGNYRPIAVLNGMAKIIELNVLKEIKHIDFQYQHGFTKYKSTASAHIVLENILKTTKGDVIFIDFSDAYNTVSLKKLI